MQSNEGEVRVALVGDLDISTTQELWEQIESLAPHGLVIDMRGVEFIDASGLRLLMRARSTARDYGHTVRLVHVPRQAHRLLRLCNLDTVFGLPEE
jgi:anti-sigma B factor antagonist